MLPHKDLPRHNRMKMVHVADQTNNDEKKDATWTWRAQYWEYTQPPTMRAKSLLLRALFDSVLIVLLFGKITKMHDSRAHLGMCRNTNRIRVGTDLVVKLTSVTTAACVFVPSHIQQYSKMVEFVGYFYPFGFVYWFTDFQLIKLSSPGTRIGKRQRKRVTEAHFVRFCTNQMKLSAIRNQ